MMKRTFLIYASKQLLFLVIPLATLITGMLYVQQSGLYFTRSVDPEYGYLMNGLVLAYLKPDIQFITNPGVPVHIMVASVSRIVHLFRPGQPLMDDVIQHPELYIRATLYAINILNVIALFLLGHFAFRYTKSLVMALFLQTMPFFHQLPIESLGRLMPESFMLIIVCAWLIVLLKLLNQGSKKINFHHYSLVFGLLFAIGLSDKLTFLPFFLLPLAFLPGWKNKLLFTGYSAIFFLIVAFPVTLNYSYFREWVVGIFTHTGAYGSGDRGFVDINRFNDHLRLLTDNNTMLVTSVLLLSLVTVVHLIRRKRNPNQRISIMSLGIILLVVLQFIMGSKHFAYHYMIPSILLIPFIIFLIIETFRLLFPQVKQQLYGTFLGIMVIAMVWSIIPRLNSQLTYMGSVSDKKYIAYQKLKDGLLQYPKIVSPSYYGCSSVEYALSYGMMVSGKYGAFLFEKVNEYYPMTYMYFPWGNVFYEGISEVKSSEFLYPGIDYTLYIADYSEEMLSKALTGLGADPEQKGYDLKLIYNHKDTKEALYRLRIGN